MMDEYESSAIGQVRAARKAAGKRHTLDELLYLLMGEASIGNMVVMVFAMAFFAATPIAMLVLFGTYSGGMRWLITLGLVAAMGFVSIYLMARGIRKRMVRAEIVNPKTEFRGELTAVTEAMERAAQGYSYSQQILRERLCEDIINKLGLARDLGTEEMHAMLDSGNLDFVGDQVLAKFLLENKRGSKGWEDSQFQAKGKSADRGKKFMVEMQEILERTEAIS